MRFLAILVFLLPTFGSAQQSLLQSGPMVGYSEMKEVQLWVQTKKEARVRIAYWEAGKRKPKFFTKEVITSEDKGYTAKLIAEQLSFDKKYHYEVYINGRLLSFPYPLQFQSLPFYQSKQDIKEFSFALGSCGHVNDSINVLPGEPFGGGYEIFESIRSKKPDFMVWLGDNVYLREVDWRTRGGFLYRYTHTRSLPALQPLLASVHHYATWDDHDYGPDDSDRSFWNKGISQEVFNLFWCNPNTNITGKGGITSKVQWNDAEFFLMDDRWFRSPKRRPNGTRELLGKDQVEWLIDALSYSNATFKFICVGTPVLNPVAVKENYSNYPDELNYLLKSIEEAKIKGVIFLTGDRHHTELTVLKRENNYPLYDLTVSPLLSRVNKTDEANTLRDPGTLVGEKNFGIVKVAGTNAERRLIIEIYNAKGEMIWTREIKASELR